MSLIGGQTEDIIQRYILDPSQYKREISEVAKLIREQTRHEKNLDLVRKELDKTTTSLTEATRKQAEATKAVSESSASWASNMTKSVTAGNLWSSAVQKGIGILKESISTLDTYSKTSDVFRGNLSKLKEATGGTVSALDLMQAQNKLVTLGVKLTDEQMAGLLASTKKLAPAMGLDMKSALESVSTALARKSEKIADNIGVVIKAETANQKFADSIGVSVKNLTDEQTSLAFVNDMLGQMKTKADATAEATTTMTGHLAKLGIYLKDNLLAILASVNRRLGDTKLIADSLGTGPWNAWIRSQDKGATRNAYMGKSAKEIQDEDRAQREYETAHYGSYYSTSTPGMGQSAAGGTGGGVYGVLSWEKEAKSRYSTGAGLHTAKKSGGGSRDKSSIFGVREWMYDELAKMAEMVTRMQEEQEEWLAKDTGKGAALDARTRADRMLEQLEQRRKAGFEWKERGGAVDKLSGTFGGSMMGNKVAEAATASADALEKYRAQVQGINADMESFTTGSLASFTGGIWAAADAAIQGGDSFGMAMAKMLKATLLSIAQQSTVKAIFNLAEAAAQWFNPVAVTSHLTAAALYGSIAVGTGAIGLGMSAAMAGSASSGASSSHSNTGSNSYRPSYGSREAADKKPIVVNVWLGGKGDPAAALYMRQQIKAAVA